MRLIRAGLAVAVGVLACGTAASDALAARPGIAPDGPWTCPSSHPIKGYLGHSGRRVYFVPASRFYDEASPERCYGTEEEARRDGADPFGWEKNFPIASRCATPSSRVSCAHGSATPTRRL